MRKFLCLLGVVTLVFAGCGGYRTGTPASQGENGVFLDDGARLIVLHEWDLIFVQPPPDVQRVGPGAARSLVVRQRYPGEPNEYHLFVVGTNEAIPIMATALPDRHGYRLAVRNGPLAPGSYVLQAPKDSLFGGKVYYYFVVEQP
jgi:hypothetical protein